MFMGKKRKAVMLGVNVFLVLALVWSVVFTVDRKNAAYTNTDIERYKSLNTIPKHDSFSLFAHKHPLSPLISGY